MATMTTPTPETVKTLRIRCEDVCEAAAYSRLWQWLKEEKGHTLESLCSIHHNSGDHLQRLVDTPGQPIHSRLAGGKDTHYFREKGWKLEITILNPSVNDCTIVLPAPPKRKQRHKK